MATTRVRRRALFRGLFTVSVVTVVLGGLSAPAYAAAPVASSGEISAYTAQPADVFLSAADGDGDPLTYITVSTPAHGSLTGDCSDGQCTYTSTGGYVGDDSFTWKANDGTSDSNVATMTIHVQDTRPVAEPEFASVEVSQSVLIGLAGNDPLGNALTFHVATAPTHGTLGAIGTPDCIAGFCSASVDYTSDGSGTTDSFTYTVSNGAQSSDPATVSISITASQGLSITSAGPLSKIVISPLLNCSVNHTGDSSGEFYGNTACGTFVAVGTTVYGPAVVPAGGVGQTPYTPVSQSKSGAGTLADPYQIHTVVNVVPGLNVDQVDLYVVGQESYRTNTTLVNTTGAPINAILYKAADCYLQDSDAGYGAYDAGSGAISCVGAAAGGGPGTRIEQFFPLSTGSSYYESGYSAVWAAVGNHVSLPNLCEQCASFIDNGAGLSYGVTVPAGGSATRSHLTTFSPLGIGPLSTTKTADTANATPGGSDGYTITVSNPNATPATLTSITDDLPAGFSYTAGSTTGATTSNPAIAGQKLTWSGSFNVPAHGNTTLHFGVVVAAGAGTYYNNAGGTTADVVVVPSGDTAPVTVAVNHAPVAGDDVLSTNQDTASSPLSVLANDTDADGDTLSVTGKTNGAHGTVTCTTTTCTYTPAAGYTGPDSFTYTVSDGHGGTDIGTVSVTVVATVNHAPVAVDDSTSTAEDTAKVVPVLTNDTDQDGDALSVTAKTDGAHGTVTCTTTTCTYTPAANFNGSDSFTYTISDGHGGTDTGTVTVTVTAVNDAPVAVDDTLTTAEDTVSAPVSVLTNDTDVDGDTLSVTSKTNGAHGTVTCTATTCTYTPAPNFNGSDSFTYTTSDGHGGTDVGAVSVTVTPVNDNPVAVDDAATTQENVAKDVSVLGNDTDVDGDTLSVTGKADGAHGTVTCTVTVCTYTPATDYVGADSFTYTVGDGHGGSGVGTVSMTVTPPGADVGVVKTTLAGSLQAGSLGGYTIVVTNHGPNASSSATVTDQLPTGFVVRTVSPASCHVLFGSLSCALAAIPDGGSVTIQVSGAFTVAGTIGNTATVTAAADPNPANNSSHVNTTVTGRTCTIIGTFGNDVPLLGTKGNDVICGLAGNDRINAKGGSDTIYGNEGNDRIDGGPGDDLVDGGPGSDTVSYGSIQHSVSCNLAKHKSTGQGTDTLISIENVLGSPKGDKITGDAKNNNLSGGAGDDVISGGAGNDNLYGGAGNDTLNQGPGHGKVRQ